MPVVSGREIYAPAALPVRPVALRAVAQKVLPAYRFVGARSIGISFGKIPVKRVRYVLPLLRSRRKKAQDRTTEDFKFDRDNIGRFF